MAFSDNQDIKKRLNYLQQQLDIVDTSLQSLPILFANQGNHQVEEQSVQVISKFKSDLRRLYSDLSMFNDIKF